MFTISKTFEFSASHQLEGLPDDHPCSRLHGHNFICRAELEGELLSPVGFVWDYRALAPFKALIDDRLDHRHLNDILAPPTAESLARWLYVELDRILYAATERGTPEEGRYIPVKDLERSHPRGHPRPDDWFTLSAVAISETPKTWSVYRP